MIINWLVTPFLNRNKLSEISTMFDLINYAYCPLRYTSLFERLSEEKVLSKREEKRSPIKKKRSPIKKSCYGIVVLKSFARCIPANLL